MILDKNTTKRNVMKNGASQSRFLLGLLQCQKSLAIDSVLRQLLGKLRPCTETPQPNADSQKLFDKQETC